MSVYKRDAALGRNHRDKWPEHYTTAIYSDDGGKTWNTSKPFAEMGTGEAALAELSDGRQRRVKAGYISISRAAGQN